MSVQEIIFYKGRLNTQFDVPAYNKDTNWRIGQIELLPRYLLTELEAISESEYNEVIANRFSKDAVAFQRKWIEENTDKVKSEFTVQPHIFKQERHLMEWEYAEHKIDTLIVEEFLFILPNVNPEIPFDGFDFLAEKDGIIHGRVQGQIFCKCIKYELIEQEKIVKDLKIEEKTLIGKGQSIIQPITELAGKQTGDRVVPNQGCIPGLSAGCMPGCGIGCFRSGCGTLLFLLLLLALLSGLWKSCHNNADNTKAGQSQNSDNVKRKQLVIHDTVYIKDKKQIRELVDSTVVRKADAILLPNVQFYTNSAKLLPYSIQSIQELAEYMNSHPSINAIINGHTDDVGDFEANMKLSQQRAETVREVLISFGVDPKKIEAKGFGSSKPKTNDKTVEGRAINRRVEVELLNTSSVENYRTEK